MSCEICLDTCYSWQIMFKLMLHRTNTFMKDALVSIWNVRLSIIARIIYNKGLYLVIQTVVHVFFVDNIGS